MKVFITGASGFLGKAVVASAVRAGHEVVAMVRPATPLVEADWDANVTILRGDLRQNGDWNAAVTKADAVIHLAAALSGDISEQFQGTVLTTERLLGALQQAPSLPRFVHISSFSVYDFAALPINAVLDENSPIEQNPRRRDAYTTAKLEQEQLVRDAYRNEKERLVVIRPGAIFGPNKAWDYGTALGLGPAALLFAPRSHMRLTYVDNCADAIVAAVTAERANGETINIVDDDLPTNKQYRSMFKKNGLALPKAIFVPWRAVTSVGHLVQLIDRFGFNNNAKLPEFLALIRQKARWQPLRYSNKKAKDILGWSPAVSMNEAIRRTAEYAKHSSKGS
jgi:2-alkyl-3-oxoalkanoate reductase